MFADAIIGLNLGTNWLSHCVLGSLLHFEHLKKDYGFKNAGQVGQLIHCIAKQLNILPLKAKEIVCKLLKVNDSKYFEGQNLFYATCKNDGEIVVYKENGVTCEESHLVSSGLDWGLECHYYPNWMSSPRDFTKSGYVVHMSSLDKPDLAGEGLLYPCEEPIAFCCKTFIRW
jgi:hypothetical protein